MQKNNSSITEEFKQALANRLLLMNEEDLRAFAFKAVLANQQMLDNSKRIIKYLIIGASFIGLNTFTHFFLK